MKTDDKLSTKSTPARDARGGHAGQQQIEANGARQDEIGNRWKRLNQHHQAAGQAFLHTVMATEVSKVCATHCLICMRAAAARAPG